VRGPEVGLSLAEIQERAPDFYNWYASLPVRDAAAIVGTDVHRKGSGTSPITIVEFSDFQCPFCSRAAKDLRELVGSSPEVSLVFRHFPLDASCNPNVQRQMHDNACLAAYARNAPGSRDVSGSITTSSSRTASGSDATPSSPTRSGSAWTRAPSSDASTDPATRARVACRRRGGDPGRRQLDADALHQTAASWRGPSSARTTTMR
jgi:hypothetical protein